MRLGNYPRQIQPQPDTSTGALARWVGPEKGFRQAFELLGRNARSVIGYR